MTAIDLAIVCLVLVAACGSSLVAISACRIRCEAERLQRIARRDLDDASGLLSRIEAKQATRPVPDRPHPPWRHRVPVFLVTGSTQSPPNYWQ